MRKVLFFGLLIIFTSCALTKQQRKDNRVAKKIEKIKLKHPDSFHRVTTETVRIDTVLQEVYIEGSTQIDTLKVTEYLTEFLHDTVEVNLFITRFIEVAKDSVSVDTLGIHLRMEGVAVTFQLTKDEQHITASTDVSTITIDNTEVVNVIPWWIWAIMIALGIIVILSLLRR